MSLVNYVVIELTLNILFFHKMKLQKIKQLLFMAQKLEKCGKKKRVVHAPMVGAITGPRGRGVNDNYVTINDTYRWQYCLTIQIHPY